MVEYMRFCQKHQIHLVSDEIYALTTFPTEDIPNPTPFTSLLSIPKDNLIDPSLCHVLHGMSKVLNPSSVSDSGLLRKWCSFRNSNNSGKSNSFEGICCNWVNN